MNAIGSIIKALTVHTDYFYLSFVGQTIAACAQVTLIFKHFF